MHYADHLVKVSHKSIQGEFVTSYNSSITKRVHYFTVFIDRMQYR